MNSDPDPDPAPDPDPYTITIPADKKWVLTTGLLHYEQYARHHGATDLATDLILLCDDIEHQLQHQIHDRTHTNHSNRSSHDPHSPYK